MSFYINKLILFIVITVITNTVHAKSHQDAVYVPKNVEQSMELLSGHLTKNESNDYDKAKNIYTWITKNFQLDTRVKSKSKNASIHQTLKRKRGSAEDFSILFDSLCHNAGVVSKQIVGYTFTENKPIIKVLYQPNHYWNAVMIDSSWYHVDCLWGSDFGSVKKLTFNVLENTVNYEVNQSDNYEKYFCPLPQDFIKTHLPSDPNWQLLQESITSKEFIQNDFSRVGKALNQNEILDIYSRMENSNYLYESSKNSFEFNSKNHKQLAISSLKKGKNMVLGNDYSQREIDEHYQQKQIYLHQAASSALSYRSNVTLYSKIEREAFVLWVRHNIEVPTTKRSKYINRYLLDKQKISQRENYLRKVYHNVKNYEDKVRKKHYMVLRKPRRKVEKDPIYFKVTKKQILESDSIIQSLEDQIYDIKNINAALKEKRKEQYLIKKSLNFSQTSYLQQFKLLLEVDVTLQVIGHQSSQITKVDNSIDILIKSINSIDKELQINNIALSKLISNMKREITTKQNLLRGLYIMSNGEDEYKIEYDNITNVLKNVFYEQTIAKREDYKALVWEFEAIKEENEELKRQQKIIKELTKIKSSFHKEKIEMISKRELSEKKFCDDITKAVYSYLSEFKTQKRQTL